jgi:4,5-dihydroxyphthalate decarboxylase
MHVVVIRRELYDANRWIARSLMQAFEAAKARAIEQYRLAEMFMGAPFMVPWMPALLEENRALMGADAWAYGVEANRNALETYLRYHADQGLSQRAWRVEDIFAPECL